MRNRLLSERAHDEGSYLTNIRLTRHKLEDMGCRADARLTEVYEAAKGLTPELGKVAVYELPRVLEKHTSPSLNPHMSSTGEIRHQIGLSPFVYDYSILVHGPHSFRAAKAREYLEGKGIEFNWQRSFEFILGHELGHADDLSRRVAQGEKPEKVLTEWNISKDAWELKKDMPKMGDPSLAEKYADVEGDPLILAYSDLPDEAHADDFALQVLRLVYG